MRLLPCDGPVGPVSADVSELAWTKTSKGCQLSVRPNEGPTVNFLGFRDKVRRRRG